MTNSEPPLSGWLLDPGKPAPSARALRGARLGAYAYTALPADSPQRASLRGDYLLSLARHQRVKAELVPLLRAWHRAGIPALLFKGFHLSEFVYPVAGARFYGDADVLVRPEQAREAIRVAAELGWRVEASESEIGVSYFHYAATLTGPGGDAYVDLHRWVIASSLPWNPVQRRITDAVWSHARERVWEGVPVREMTETDAIIVGLALGRCWSLDRGRLKAHDVLDFRLLASRVHPDEIRRRARELGCERTLRRFMERCDPAEGRLHFHPPSRAARWRSALAAWVERGPVGTPELALSRLLRAPEAARALLPGIRWVLHARRALRRSRDPNTLLPALSPAAAVAAPALCTRRRFRTVLGIRLASRLLRTNPRGDCLVRSLAVYAALRTQGWPVGFVSGVRRDASGVVGHAWVEMDGKVLWELLEPANRRMYRVHFEFPNSPGNAPSERERSAAEDELLRLDTAQQIGDEVRGRCA